MGLIKSGLVLRLQNLLRQRNNPTWSCNRDLKQLPNGYDGPDEDYIKSVTVISNDHLTPELSLHLITPDCEAWFCDANKLKFATDPFWAIYWPGGQSLSRYILNNQHLFRNKNVLDVGSGSGACAIAAAKCKANVVLANDIDKLSLKAIRLNARLNKVKIFLEEDDIIGTDIDSLTVKENGVSTKPKWDVVLVGDMFYDCEFSKKLFKWLCELNDAGKTVLIGDPGRYAMKTILKTGKLVKVADFKPADSDHFGFSSFDVWKISHSRQNCPTAQHKPKFSRLCTFGE